jgi:hypothetical protein
MSNVEDRKNAREAETVTEGEARTVKGAGESFGSLLHVKRHSDRGATPVMMQGCGCGGGGSSCV